MRWLSPHRRRTMLVTGATGFLGRHLADGSSNAHWEWIAPSSRSLDVRNADEVMRQITDWRPRVVVHLAYRKSDARTIIDGSANVAVAAARCGARLIHLSTDVVFAGREAPYIERDVPDAVMEYGRWKATAERRVASVDPGAVLLRTSLLYGTNRPSSGQAELLSHRQGLTYYTDEYRCPVHAADVAQAIYALADQPGVRGPLHVAGPQAISRAALAHAFAGWFGLGDGAIVTATRGAAGISDAERPGRVVLDTTAAAALGITCRPLADALR